MATIKQAKRKPKAKNKNRELWIKALGSRVKHLRLEHELSQADLAYSLKIDSQTISRLERGIVAPSAYLIKQICEELDISLSEFYKSL